MTEVEQVLNLVSVILSKGTNCSVYSAIVDILQVKGSHYAMGQQQGEAFRDKIHELYTLRLKAAFLEAKKYGRTITEEYILELSRCCLNSVEDYHPDGYEELRGIASGSNLSLEKLWAMNALTDLRDLAGLGALETEGCTAVVLGQSYVSLETGSSLAGQTWDLFTDNQPYIVVVRREPIDAPRTISLTTTGCLSLIGMNEKGVCVGTTNVKTKDVQIGVCYLDVIHSMLHSLSFQEAKHRLFEARRVGAHFFFLTR